VQSTAETFRNSTSHSLVCHISCVKSYDSQHELVTSPNKDEQDICPGYDDKNEAPIGCSVTKDTLVNMGVTHQWILLFQNGGWSEVEDHGKNY